MSDVYLFPAYYVELCKSICMFTSGVQLFMTIDTLSRVSIYYY